MDVVDERTGILVPPGDPHALRRAINQLFNMDLEGMGRAAREFSRHQLDWNPIASDIQKLYHNILLPHSSPAA